MVFGGPPEFKTRADGIPGLKKNYGLVFKNFKPTDESGTVTFTDLMNGKVQAADVFTTPPQIITDHLVVLADPKNNFAAQNVIPLVYKPGVNAKIIGVLNAISAELTTHRAAGDGHRAGRQPRELRAGRGRLPQGHGPWLNAPIMRLRIPTRMVRGIAGLGDLRYLVTA